MTKVELVEYLRRSENPCRLKKYQIAGIVNAVFETIKSELIKGGEVAITGFGVFELSDYKACEQYDIQTKKMIKRTARKVVHFKVGKPLKKEVMKNVD